MKYNDFIGFWKYITDPGNSVSPLLHQQFVAYLKFITENPDQTVPVKFNDLLTDIKRISEKFDQKEHRDGKLSAEEHTLFEATKHIENEIKENLQKNNSDTIVRRVLKDEKVFNYSSLQSILEENKTRLPEVQNQDPKYIQILNRASDQASRGNASVIAPVHPQYGLARTKVLTACEYAENGDFNSALNYFMDAHDDLREIAVRTPEENLVLARVFFEMASMQAFFQDVDHIRYINYCEALKLMHDQPRTPENLAFLKKIETRFFDFNREIHKNTSRLKKMKEMMSLDPLMRLAILMSGGFGRKQAITSLLATQTDDLKFYAAVFSPLLESYYEMQYASDKDTSKLICNILDKFYQAEVPAIRILDFINKIQSGDSMKTIRITEMFERSEFTSLLFTMYENGDKEEVKPSILTVYKRLADLERQIPGQIAKIKASNPDFDRLVDRLISLNEINDIQNILKPQQLQTSATGLFAPQQNGPNVIAANKTVSARSDKGPK